MNLAAIGVAAIVAGVVFIVLAVIPLVRWFSGSILTRVPITAEQTVFFPEPGQYILYGESSRFSWVFRGLTYVMTDPSGAEVPNYVCVFKTTVSGFARMRRSLRRFVIQHPGEHRLRVYAATPRDTSEGTIVFTRAFPLKGFVWFAGMGVGVGMVLVGAIVAASQT